MLTRQRAPAGFTLAELLVAAVLLGIIGAAVLSVTIGQMRLHVLAVHGLAARQTVRTGADVLRTDLRGLAPVSGDIYAAEPNGIEFRAPAGASIVCHIDAARTMVGIPPTAATEGALTSWAVPPQPGDTLLIHDGEYSEASAHAAREPGAGGWRAHVLTAAPAPGGTCPTSSGFTRSPAEAAAALALRLSPPLASDVRPGAALRFVRRARYQLYRASDGLWYVGHLDCLPSRATPCATIQPVVGPFESNGVHFAYRDSTGAVTSDPTRVARIDVHARAPGLRMPHAGGYASHGSADSLLITIAPRNR